MAMSLNFPRVYDHNIIDMNHAKIISNKIMNDFEVSDLNICVTNEKLPAHKVILASFSEYFLAMFTCGLRETLEDYADLSETDADTVKIILKYMYSGSLEMTEDTLESILKAAYFYQAHDVVYACCDYFTESLAFHNCIGIMMTADLYALECLQKSSRKFVNENFLKILGQDEFLNLNLDGLSKILESDDIAVEVEDQVFICITTWIDFKKSERKVHLLELLKLMKLPLVSKMYLNNQLSDYCQSSPECIDYVESHGYANKQFINPRATPKFSLEKIIIVGDFGSVNMDIRQYDPITNSWSKCMELDNRKRGFGVVTLNESKLLVLGGIANNEIDDVLDCIDMKSRSIYQASPLPVKCHSFAVAKIGNGNGLNVFVVGGKFKNNFVNVLQKWNNGTDSWSFGPALNFNRMEHGMAALNKNLYVAGGWTGTTTLNSVEIYDPRSETWSDGCPMNEKRRAVGMAAVGEYVYAVGGMGEKGQILSTVEKYDPKTDTWKYVKSMPRGRQGVHAVGLGNRMIVLGGSDKSPEVLQYLIDTDEWKYIAPIEGVYAEIGAIPMT